MGFFNSGGMITRGYGDDHRIVTRGMSMRFDFGGIRLREKISEYTLKILMPISKEDSMEMGIYSPLEVRKDEKRSITSSVSKELEEDLSLFTGIDHSLLSRILDAI